MKHLFFIILTIGALQGCGCKDDVYYGYTNDFSLAELALNPYQRGDTLVFIDKNQQKHHLVCIRRTDTLITYPRYEEKYYGFGCEGDGIASDYYTFRSITTQFSGDVFYHVEKPLSLNFNVRTWFNPIRAHLAWVYLINIIRNLFFTITIQLLRANLGVMR